MGNATNLVSILQPYQVTHTHTQTHAIKLGHTGTLVKYLYVVVL